ncbi:hypothetical protein MY11210_003666 [Beauveria gryllotalpidicola]
MGWTIYGDGYKASDGTLVASSSGGSKAILNTPWTDAEISMDVKLDGDTGDAGFILRRPNMGTGPDAYSGYYAGISASGWVVLGRVNNGWSQIGWSNASVAKYTWQKLRVRAIRDKIEVFLGSGSAPLITARDAAFGSGLVGTRVYYTGASFKSLSILPSRFEDFRAMPDDWIMTPNDMIVVAEGEARAADSTKYADVVVEANLAIINEVSGESGILFRTSNVKESSYRGYHAYLSLENGVVLGRQDDAGWKQLQSAKVELKRETVYNLRVEAYDSSIYVYLDGEMNLRAGDSIFMRGVVGLRSAYALTQFQGVYITGQRPSRVIDDFSDGTMAGWQIYSGEFDASSQALVAKSAIDGKAALGSFFANISITMDIAFPDGGGGGGGDAGTSPDGWVRVGRMDRGWHELRRGKTWEVQGPTKMIVSASGDTIRVVVHRQVLVETQDGMFAGGLMGVRTYQTDVSFDNLLVREIFKAKQNGM